MPATVVLGTQWGDEGKGKFIDRLSASAEMVVRYQGGNNAGHTVIAGEVELKLHLVPSGVAHPHTIPVIGAGVVIDPEVLLAELDMLEQKNLDPGRLRISGNAHLVMPYHLLLDRVQERWLGGHHLGTTKRGIGPCYADKVARVGLRMQDLFDEKIFRAKLESTGKEKNRLLTKVYGQLPIDITEVADRYLAMGERIRPLVADTGRMVDALLREGGQVLFESAQATMLDLDHGTYPYVTSSTPISGGVCAGVGVGPRHLERIIGVSKAYTTRVGAGPFPTEDTGPDGRHLRDVGVEYGTTTGRERRCGWYDAVVNRYAVRLSTLTELMISKLDVLTGLDPVKLCVAYEIDGERTDEMPWHQTDFHHAVPVYEEWPGWYFDINDCRSWEELPSEARAVVDRMEELAEVPVTLIGVGPARHHVVERAS